jgi:signal transduction histidine kinase
MNRRSSLFRKYARYFVVLVTTALVGSGLVGLYFTYQETKAAALNLQSEKADAAAVRIQAYVDGIVHELSWMHFPLMEGTSLEQRRIDYLKLLRQAPAITDVVLVDKNGIEQLRASRLLMDQAGSNIDWSKEEKFKVALSGKPYFSSVYFRKETEPYMTIALMGSGPEAGVTVAEVNLKFIWEVVSTIKIGKRGLAYAVDSQGRLIAHPDITQVLQQLDLSALPQVKAALEDRGGQSLRQVSVSRNLQGDEVLTAHASIAPLGWHVFVEQPITEAFAPLFALMLRTGLLLLVGLIFAVIASLYLARRMARPIQAIQIGAAEIATGNLDQRLDLKTGDELEALASQFNNMAAQLKDSYAGLERKVEERTRELSESLEQQTTTSEILRVISSLPTGIQPVLDIIAESATRFCAATDAFIYLVESGMVHLVAHYGPLPVPAEARLLTIADGTLLGGAIFQCRTVHIQDKSDEYGFAQSSEGSACLPFDEYRSCLITPLIRERVAIGAIALGGLQPNLFSEKQMRILETFASQAVIAIENVRLFNEIQDKGRQLEMASKHKSDFLASMSHELRTPLNAIIGFSEVLQERMFGEINEKQSEYLADIHSSGVHLLSLINDILDLSKIEAGRMDLELSRFNLAEALQNCLTLIRERATRHGISVALEVDSEVGDYVADERKFKQILLNLLSNAVKFTPEGGRIRVRARYADRQVEISVSDTGIGIPENDLAIIFEEFRQVGTDRLKKTEGTGLGLALTKKFVELHGGRIGVQSTVGKGSTFTFSLPAKELDAA